MITTLCTAATQKKKAADLAILHLMPATTSRGQKSHLVIDA